MNRLGSGPTGASRKLTAQSDTAFRRTPSSAGIFVLAVLAGILAIAYLVNAGESARIGREANIKETKLRETKKYIARNYDALIGGKETVQEQGAARNKPLLTIIKESAEAVGLTNNLSGMSPEENKKLGLISAKVALRRVRLADVVNFLVYVRSKYPGVMDREGKLRIVPRQQGDNWDAFVSLTMKKR